MVSVELHIEETAYGVLEARVRTKRVHAGVIIVTVRSVELHSSLEVSEFIDIEVDQWTALGLQITSSRFVVERNIGPLGDGAFPVYIMTMSG